MINAPFNSELSRPASPGTRPGTLLAPLSPTARRKAPASALFFVYGMIATTGLATAPAPPALADEPPVEFLLEGGSTGSGDTNTLSKLAASPPEGVRTGKINSKVFGAHHIALTLPDGTGIEALRDREIRGEGTDITWLGQIRNQPGSLMSFTSTRDVVTGFLHYGTDIYEIIPDTTGNLVIYRVDQSKLPMVDHDVLPPPHNLAANTAESGADLAFTADSSSTGGHVHDLLIVYTSAARQRIGEASLQSVIRNAVASANQAYQNSQIDLMLNLVHMTEVNYLETGDMGLTLERLAIPDDGFMDNVHQLRNQYRADLVAMVSEDTSACGLAYLNPGTLGSPTDAFSVTRSSCLSSQTLAHEVGHNQGNRHDRANSAAASGGAFPYSFGFRRCNTDGTGFRDIMSYSSGCGSVNRINYFSNPDVRYNGYATGIAYEADPANSADTARSMRNTAAHIQAYRGAVTPSLKAPSALVVTKLYSRQISLKWTDNSTDESGFRIEQSTDGVSFTEIATLAKNTTTYTSTGLSAGTWYYFRVRAYNSGNSEYSNTSSARTRSPDELGFIPPLRVLGHIQSYGDRVGTEQQWVGTKGRSLRLEGFQVDFINRDEAPGLELEYMCHIQSYGDRGWYKSGTFCGTRGRALRLEGLAIRTAGPAASQYDVVYYCHVQGYGDRGPYKNGAFCGTRGQKRRVEAIYVYVVKK